MNLNEIKSGMRVRTNSELEDATGMFVADRYLAARRPNTDGTVRTWVPGHGGEVWRVDHDDETVAVYAFTEFEPIEVRK